MVTTEGWILAAAAATGADPRRQGRRCDYGAEPTALGQGRARSGRGGVRRRCRVGGQRYAGRGRKVRRRVAGEATVGGEGGPAGIRVGPEGRRVEAGLVVGGHASTVPRQSVRYLCLPPESSEAWRASR